MKTKTLLRLALTFSILHSAFCINAQWVSIPDTNFGKWLNTNGYIACLQGNSQIGWQMDTSCPAVVGAISVDCTNKNIGDLTGIQYFDNLATLIFEYNDVDSISAWPPGIVTVDCHGNRLSKMATFPNTLTYLRCNNNYMRTFPPMPNSLTWLDCSVNPLTGGMANLSNTSLETLFCIWDSLPLLPNLPPTIRNVYCYGNDITALNTLPNGLLYISCYGNKITTVQPLPATLEVFIAAQNQISSLPPLPTGLHELSVSGNLLTSLPALPSGLNKLYCDNNFLTSLPALPTSLWMLYCGHNQLTALPPFNSTFNYQSVLDCSHNQLTSLPTLPIYLGSLDCSYNQLTSLPALPQVATFDLKCSNNMITAIPPIYNAMYSLLCDSNLTLTCLPYLKQITTLNFSNTAVQCVPNYGTVTNSTPLLSSLPLCSQSNPDGCTIYENITGRIYFDLLNICADDSTSAGLPNIKLLLRSGGNLAAQCFSGGEGLYSFDTDTNGIYQTIVDTAGLPFYTSCPLGNMLLDTISAATPFAYNKNFGLQCDGFDIVTWSIVSIQNFRPAEQTIVKSSIGDMANFYGVNCVSGIGGTITITINGPASYISPASGALTPTVSGNVLTYTIADFGNVNFNSDFNIIVQTDTTAPLGSQVCFTVAVTPTVGDNNPANNTLTHCFTVVGSYDPNDKQVYPQADIDPNGDGWLTYTINFQNTGTDTAIHIYITDTLDGDLDVASFQLLAYSHQPLVQIKENAVRFNFPNIMLVDSHANEPLSHGYVQYKIKLKDNLAAGTQIHNTAFIYFDFNAPVVTNTTSNTIAILTAQPPSPLKGGLLRIYPNPASDVVTISVDESMIGGTATVYDITGRRMAAVELVTRNTPLVTADFPSGVYIAEITPQSAASAVRVRWVKMN